MRWWYLVILCVLPAVPAFGQTRPHVFLERSGWRIDCNTEDASLTISTESLGLIAGDIHLNEETTSGVRRLTHLTAHIDGGERLRIDTTAPTSAWELDVQPGKIEIIATDFHGVITAHAASPQGRIIATLIDPLGEPVNWQGTDELVNGWGGARTVNRSYLPRHHPEVLHMGLGQVSGAGMHSLFDRQTDTAIDFGEDATLQAQSGMDSAFDLTMPVRDRGIIQLTPDYYTHSLGVPFYVPYDDKYSPTAPIVWSSWTGYYETVTEQDMVRNTDWLAARLKPYGFQYVVLDDGYDRLADFDSQDVPNHSTHVQSVGHSWIENWSPDRFPHGPEWLTSYIHGKGLKAGVWLVPNVYGPGLKQHPDWYLYDKQGKVLLDYSTPALDSTNPRVLEFLNRLFTRLDAMGFDYFKFDGEPALPQYAPPVDKTRLYEPHANFIENYRQRFSVIRQTIGPRRFIEECPAGSPLNGIGFVNSYFNGQDLYGNWQGMYAMFSAIGNDLFLNHVVTYVMPGEGIELGEPMTMAKAATRRPAVALEVERSREDPQTGFGTTLAEARTIVSYIALTGVTYPIASVMPDLPEDRVKLLQATMPTLPILPIDLFSRGTDSTWDKFKHVRPDSYIHHFPEVLDLKVKSAAGVYDVSATTNWRSGTTERNMTFEQLGLDSTREYVVFDFWNQKPMGVFKDHITLSIEPHDTRVLLIHPLAHHPQLIGNSRHISGTYSIVNQEWSEDKKEFHGQSAVVPGVPYTLWFTLPIGYEESAAVATSKSGMPIKTVWKPQGEAASLTFAGDDVQINWSIQFK